MIAARMKENLKAKNPGELKTRLTQAKNTARKESEGFTHLDSTMTIQGITMRKMSEASKEKYLKYYKNTNFKERQELVSDWKDLVENEAELAHELEKICKDNPEGLKLAIGSFEELDFVAKKKSLKQHEKLVEKSKGKEELEKNLTIKAAHAKIDAAARKNTIAPGSDKTQGRYKKFFENPDNFKNPKTKKPGDLGALKKAYETLVSGSPNTKYKNLSAYEQRRKEYQKNLKKLSEINPSIGKDELKKWQQRYDKEGWTKRTKIGEQDLPKEIEKQKQEHLKKLKEEKEIGITDSEKREAKERSPDRIKLELSINEYLAENTKESINEGRKALRLYLVANPDEENDTVLMYLEEQLAKAAREFGSQKVKEKSQEKMAEKEVEKALSQDEILKRQLEDEQIKHLNIHGAEISEQRHNKTISAQERAKKESIARTKAGTVEDELTRDAYEQMGDQHILNKEGTGEKIDDVMFMDGVSLQKDSRDQIKHHTYQQQSKLDTKEGFTHVKLKDKSGREISAEEAEALQEKDFEKIEDTLVDKAQDKVEKKGAKIFDLNAQIAAKRKAKELVDAKKHEKLRAA